MTPRALQCLLDPLDGFLTRKLCGLRKEHEPWMFAETFKLFLRFYILFDVSLLVTRSGSECVLVTPQAHIVGEVDVAVLNHGSKAADILGCINSCVHVD